MEFGDWWVVMVINFCVVVERDEYCVGGKD